ncbi:MAG: TIGR03750 family conjugal transfer protein [Pasteurella oralis]|uniref:TIGR03750 family conjugal transfer protein n=1 Tax=Pasteurella oralis TaxID=1071947 RepID=UPI00270C5E2A|nr:TIGR03750 family conjugal transfer protein [Pasteurella oralis]
MIEKANNVETIAFIPERLNRRPPVFRGMTFFELVLVLLIGSGIGAVFGLLLALFFHLDWYVIPMGMLVVGFLSTRFGGAYISRLKRGKPDTWLDRFVEFKFKRSQFITQSTYWSIKRTSKKVKRK